MMRDSQSTMNAAVRIWLDNLALSSGPMLEVNTDPWLLGKIRRYTPMARVLARRWGWLYAGSALVSASGKRERTQPDR